MRIRVVLTVIIMVLMINDLQCQNKSKKIVIRGIVTDAEKRPLEGAMIFIDTRNTGIITGAGGNYKVKVKPDAEKLTVFTYTSGSADEMIQGRTTINVVVDGSQPVDNNEQAEDPGNEAVRVGYGVVKDKTLTMPVNNIDASGDEYASYSNVYDMIAGRVPGVQVSGKKIVIRGVATNSTNTDPLLIVDGVIVQTIDNIHPIMVESIQVLKGAAASIYGVQGANGVIMINLKK